MDPPRAWRTDERLHGRVATETEELEERGITHGQVMELDGFGIAILSFNDPDGVHLELTAPL